MCRVRSSRAPLASVTSLTNSLPARKFAALPGGKVGATGQLGKGSPFSLAIPLRYQAYQAAAAAAEAR